VAPLSVSVADPAFEARAANWMYSNHNRRAGEAREIVSSSPPPPVALFSQIVVRGLFNQAILLGPSCLSGRLLYLLARKDGDGRRSQRKSNNREISFRQATISTPIGQTRFLLLIKLTRTHCRRRVASQAVCLFASGTPIYHEETCVPPSDRVARGAEVWLGQTAATSFELHNVVCDYVIVSEISRC